MAHRSRIRRIAKWFGLLVCAMLVAAWAVSGKWAISARHVGSGGISRFLYLHTGQLEVCPRIYINHPPFTKFTHMKAAEWNVDWHLPRLTLSAGVPYLYCPLWLLFGIVAIPTLILFMRDHRPRPGHCRKCGYNLTGNVSGRCPEYGKEVEALPNS